MHFLNMCIFRLSGGDKKWNLKFLVFGCQSVARHFRQLPLSTFWPLLQRNINNFYQLNIASSAIHGATVTATLRHVRCVVSTVYCSISVTRYSKSLCVELYTNQNARSASNLGIKTVHISTYNSFFVRSKYTSNMAACYDIVFFCLNMIPTLCYCRLRPTV